MILKDGSVHCLLQIHFEFILSAEEANFLERYSMVKGHNSCMVSMNALEAPFPPRLSDTLNHAKSRGFAFVLFHFTSTLDDAVAAHVSSESGKNLVAFFPESNIIN